MKQELSKPFRSPVVRVICWTLLIFTILYVGRSIYLVETRSQREETTRKEDVKELWQRYMAKDPNEDELWHIATTKDYMPKGLRDLAAHAFVKKTDLEKRLIYLLESYDYSEELGLEISDKLLRDGSSLEVLRMIIREVPERTELAVAQIDPTTDPNAVGYDCFQNIILSAPFYRKWAWKNILSNPDWITKNIQWCFAVDPNFPDEAIDIYFGLSLQPENYRWVIKSAVRRKHKLRAWKEFVLTNPKNEEVRKILSWLDEYPPEIKILAGKYLLANNPSENDLKWTEEQCPSLKEECQKERKKLIKRTKDEKEKELETKKGILKELMNRFY